MTDTAVQTTPATPVVAPWRGPILALLAGNIVSLVARGIERSDGGHPRRRTE